VNVERPRSEPGAVAWCIAFVSLILPWAAAVFGIAGLWQVAHGEGAGWWYIALGGVLLVADALIDLVWAHPSILPTDQPDLNRRGDQFIGMIVRVEEAIDHGRGKVRVGDTLWSVEGPDAPAGAEVRVTASRGTLLCVEKP
jgi:membrane protein implicated in regulation of membrane protease activity